MLHEYALDPSVLTNWQSFRYFFENFGVPQGRMISQYPKKWKKLVYEACSGCRDIERSRIEQRLADIDDRLFRTTALFDAALPWLVNAETNRKAFRAVISTANPSRHDNIIIADDISDTDPLWRVDREKPVLRTAQELAACAGRLLEHAREVLFIDPHFDATKPRYRNTLKAFLEKIPEPGKLKRIEYHVSNTLLPGNFSGSLQEHLPRIMSRDVTITFIRWQEANSGDSLHPRYILTDRGGIRIEHGLDEEHGGPTADVSLLDSTLFKSRWDDYQKNTAAYFDKAKAKPTFVYVDEFSVTGTR
ncbi:MAG TPA: hypothetical protein HPP97_14620 [Desulfuromonadales bacterium]|nr:hypothetical protein [Desulfuromonadales bacterium]